MINPKHHMSKSGLFFSAVFCCGTVMQVLILFFVRRESLLEVFTSFNIVSMMVIAVLFFVSAFWERIAIIQPLILLATFPLPMTANYTTFYGLGLFVCGVVLLYKGGFLKKHRIQKLVLLAAYLYGIELWLAISTHGFLPYSFTPVFFITAFLSFLYLMFREKVVVYLKEEKPILSLTDRGLSESERNYVFSVLAGKSYKEIASDSTVSESTVRNTLARAYKKLDVADKSGLIAFLGVYDVKV